MNKQTRIGLMAVLCLVAVLCVASVIWFSLQDRKRQTGFRLLPSQVGESADKKSIRKNPDASTDRLAKMEIWLKKTNYKLLKMTFAGPIITSKPDSREVSELADFWLCEKTIPSVKALLTTSVSDNGKFIEVQFPLTVKDDALKLAQHLDPALYDAMTALLEGSEAPAEKSLAGGYSVALSTNSVTAPDKKAIVIRSAEGNHVFKPEEYETARSVIMTMYKVPKTQPDRGGK
jgi:hypothetical protein